MSWLEGLVLKSLAFYFYIGSSAKSPRQFSLEESLNHLQGTLGWSLHSNSNTSLIETYMMFRSRKLYLRNLFSKQSISNFLRSSWLNPRSSRQCVKSLTNASVLSREALRLSHERIPLLNFYCSNMRRHYTMLQRHSTRHSNNDVEVCSVIRSSCPFLSDSTLIIFHQFSTIFRKSAVTISCCKL